MQQPVQIKLHIPNFLLQAIDWTIGLLLNLNMHRHDVILSLLLACALDLSDMNKFCFKQTIKFDKTDCHALVYISVDRVT